MREVAFEVLPGMGPRGGSERRTGSPVDLLREIPYLLSMGRVPPHLALNDLLARGESDAGMSGGARWEPFTLAADEWAEVAAAFVAEGLTAPTVPGWVLTHSDWHIWLMEDRFGVPAEEHRRLTMRSNELQAARDAAQAASDESRFLELHVAFARAEAELADFLNRYIRTTRG